MSLVAIILDHTVLEQCSHNFHLFLLNNSSKLPADYPTYYILSVSQRKNEV